MEEMITVTYKEMEIEFSEGADRWSCGDLDLSSASLSELKQKIDKALKKDFERFTVLHRSYGYGKDQEYEVATVTSVDDSNPRRKEAWILGEGGKRSKVLMETLYAHTPDNVALAMRIDEIHKEIGELTEKIRSVAKKMKPAVFPQTNKEKE